MAAHDSPIPRRRPFDLDTGEFRPAVWDRWRAWDPIQRVDAHANPLRRLRAIDIDGGTKDEFALHWGACLLAARLAGHGIAVRHEEFDDGHMNITYRYDVSLPFLVAEAIVAAGG